MTPQMRKSYIPGKLRFLSTWCADGIPITKGVILIIVIILSAHAIAFGDVVVGGAVTGSGLLEVLVGGRGFLLTEGSDVGHD